MITKQITEKYYKEKITPHHDAKVQRLDGHPISEGFATVFYDFENTAGYGLYYRKGRNYYETFVRLRKPNGRLVGSFSDGLNKEVVYHAERPGRYPDDIHTFRRFTAAKQTMMANKETQGLPHYIENQLRIHGDDTLVHCYPGNLFLLDDREEHCDRYRSIDPRWIEEDYTSDTFEDVEEFLFDMFLLFRLKF